MLKFNGKRLLALTLSAALLFVAGCGSTNAPAETTTTPAETTTTPAETTDAEVGTTDGEVEPEVVYTINSTQQAENFVLLIENFAKNVTELSNGRIQFDIIATGTAGSSTEALTSVQMGTLDFVNGGDSELGSLVPGSDWCALPYFITSHEQADEVWFNGFVGEYADELYANSGLVSVCRVDNTFRTLGVQTGRVESADDLVGMKVRVPNAPIALRIYELMGALPVVIAAPEVLMALEQGTIDAADNAVILFENFSQLDGFESVTLLNYGFSTANVFCSKLTWDAMPPEDQEIMLEAGILTRDWYNDYFVGSELELIEELREEGKLIEPDAEFTQTMYELADVIWQEALESGNYDETFIDELYSLYQSNVEALTAE